MKRLTIGLIIVLVACGPWDNKYSPSAGFAHAKAPTRGTIIVNDTPQARIATTMWNNIAGRALFTIRAAGPHHVEFRFTTPLLQEHPNGTKTHRQAWVQPLPRYDSGPYTKCIVHLDPSHPRWNDPPMWAHELGHCLGLKDFLSCAYRGVMSYCNFYTDRSQWWTQTDKLMLVGSGY